MIRFGGKSTSGERGPKRKGRSSKTKDTQYCRRWLNFWWLTDNKREKQMDSDYIQMTEEVTDAINGELSYQSSICNSDRADIKDNGLAGQLVTLGTYADKARDAWTLNKGEEAALHELRKVAAISIRALERFGCPVREKPNDNDNRK